MEASTVRCLWASLLLTAALFLFPLSAVQGRSFAPPAVQESPPDPIPLSAASAERETAPPERGERDAAAIIRVLREDEVEEMSLADYLAGVLRGEMPAAFPEEALKAQAVAARTFTLYTIRRGSRHGSQADICTVSSCCQAFLEEAVARENWGAAADQYEAKIRRAVAQTDGEVVLYDDEPILAAFHAASAGRTRPAGEVWTSDLPYLQSVPSAEGESAVPDYFSRAEFTPEAFRKAVLERFPEARFTDDPSLWITDAVRDEAGSVISLRVGGVTMKGGTLRSILGLRSACFTWKAGSDGIVFSVTGHGHGVGMSQQGARTMAEAGADYREILTHYYTGVTVGVFRET